MVGSFCDGGIYAQGGGGPGKTNPYSPLGCALVWLVWSGGPWVVCVESVGSSVTHGLPLLGSGGGGRGPVQIKAGGAVGSLWSFPGSLWMGTPGDAARHRAPGKSWFFELDLGVWVNSGAQLEMETLQETCGTES